MSDDQPKCPVDHTSRQSWKSLLWKTAEPSSGPEPNDSSCKMSSQNACPVPSKTPMAPHPVPQTSEDQDKCPVDHDARAIWASKVSLSTNAPVEAIEVANDQTEHDSKVAGCTSDQLSTPSPLSSNVNLPTDRETSSIPRTQASSNWIYPSQKQFFEAMKRKNWEPEAKDMSTVVPIHNAVNERAWFHILQWEQRYKDAAERQCGGITLTSFKGDSKKLTPRAWFNSTVLGYEKPFDRHDWVVDRCGVEVPYVIDFYSGKATSSDGRAVASPSFFLDVRPKLNSYEGVKLRLSRALGWS